MIGRWLKLRVVRVRHSESKAMREEAIVRSKEEGSLREDAVIGESRLMGRRLEFVRDSVMRIPFASARIHVV